MSYVESLFSLEGKTAVVIGGTGVLAGLIMALFVKPFRRMLGGREELSPEPEPAHEA